MYLCWSCQAPLDEGDFKRGCYCERCGRDTRCCIACRHYAPDAYNDCREPIAERVVDKEKSNFCDLFTPRQDSETDAQAQDPLAAAKKAAEDLFK
uniref:Uncharacterized protein n=1 Tax=Magnetococcus massalia (strain MO-1) TaxID=451514 RepID=A0A1S7LEW0_MAGMO|nr:conserved protein of unknown function [Candidatus Magnetococcus massalia]